MGNALTIGIDEVGRGPWAGPLVAVAVCLSDQANLSGLADSKQLSPAKRTRLLRDIRQQAHAIGIGWSAPARIDRLGLSTSTGRAMRVAWSQLPSEHGKRTVYIDGDTDFLADIAPPTQCVPRGDQQESAISAASVVAKVARDRFMQTCAEIFPGYGFEAHVGYGTAQHKAALSRLGPCALHRYSFSPVKRVSNK
ncbi:ribonuclease HII [Candidatus Saccharibacteria bacterium QS_8_54_8]|nr:MAG: ribonuclease HII [Candidatus Saccharibacteria bacterium QS_8_54_8]